MSGDHRLHRLDRQQDSSTQLRFHLFVSIFSFFLVTRDSEEVHSKPQTFPLLALTFQFLFFWSLLTELPSPSILRFRTLSL